MPTAEPGTHVSRSSKDPKQSRLSGGRGLSRRLALRTRSPCSRALGVRGEPGEEVRCLRGLSRCRQPHLTGYPCDRTAAGRDRTQGDQGALLPHPFVVAWTLRGGRALTGSEVACLRPGAPALGSASWSPQRGCWASESPAAPDPPNVFAQQTCVCPQMIMSALTKCHRNN